MGTRVRRSRGRLPARVRHALRTVEEMYTAGTDGQYDDALAALARACVGLDSWQRHQVNARLTAAKQRVDDHAFAVQVRTALASGRVRPVKELGDGVELVQVDTDDMEQLLLTLPTPLPTDSPEVVGLVQRGRSALLAGRCPECGAVVTAVDAQQLMLDHARKCPLASGALAAARAKVAREDRAAGWSAHA